MKKIIIFLLGMIILIFEIFNTTAFSNVDQETNQIKVMGYFCENPFTETVDEAVEFNGLTHIIYAFLKPKSDGTFYSIQKPELLKDLIEKSHIHNVKVIISIGGVFYNNDPLVKNFENLAKTESGRKNFINGVESFIDEYGVDGVELDWEYPNKSSQQNFEKLVIELKQMLVQKGKTLSAAVAGAGSLNTTAESVSSITSTSLACFDWINIMAYDLGSGLSGQHSPYWFSNVSIDYWLNRGVPAEKIILGVPLYARPSWKQYRHIVKLDPENAYLNYIPGEKLDSYYNGLNLISEKTRLVLNKAGGIMFFDIHEDTHDDTSLQKAVISMIERSKNKNRIDLFIVLENRELIFNPEEGLGTPYIDAQNRTMLPVRKALEAVGARVEYDHKNRLVTATKNDLVVKFILGERYLNINGKLIEMDTTSVLKDNRSFLPLRWVYESFGYEIIWHSGSQTIYVQ